MEAVIPCVIKRELVYGANSSRPQYSINSCLVGNADLLGDVVATGGKGKALVHALPLEPISKLLEEHRDAGELDKAKEVSRIVLPANQQPPFPLQPGKEPFDEPAALIAA